MEPVRLHPCNRLCPAFQIQCRKAAAGTAAKRWSTAAKRRAMMLLVVSARRSAAILALLLAGVTGAAEPPAINPFGKAPSEREDAVPGYVELSDGSVHPGMIYLTRDKRLQIYDEQLERQREVPLQAVKEIECSVKREWMEREWRFKETTSDEKVYTGRTYPAGVSSHDHTRRRPNDHRAALGNRLRPAAAKGARPNRPGPAAAESRAVLAQQAQQGRTRSGTEITGLRQADKGGKRRFGGSRKEGDEEAVNVPRAA